MYVQVINQKPFVCAFTEDLFRRICICINLHI